MAEILNPHDADLESVILGACLAESTAMVLVSGKLCPEMFYEAKYGEIFAALLAMHRAGKAIDIRPPGVSCAYLARHVYPARDD